MTTNNNSEATTADYNPTDRLFGGNAPTQSARQTKGHKSWVSLAVIIVLCLISIWGVSHYVTYGSKVGASFEASDCDPVTHTRLEGKVPTVYKGNIKKYKEDGGRVNTVNCMVQTAK